MERFAKIVNGYQLLTIFTKRSILDIWQGSEYASSIMTYLFIFDLMIQFGLNEKWLN